VTHYQASTPFYPGSAVAHSIEYIKALQFIQRRTGLGQFGARPSGERRRVLETLARGLLKRVRSSRVVFQEDAALTGAFDAAFSDVLLEQFERDDLTCWVVTDALVVRTLRQTNRAPEGRDPSSERGEQLQDARGRALAELEGGRYPVRKYREKIAAGACDEGLTFWKYYQDAVRRKTISPFRIKRFTTRFWEGKASLEQPSTEDEFRLPEPRDPRRVAERALASARRSDARRQAMAAVRLLAERGASPSPGDEGSRKSDPNCEVVLKFIDWLLARPEGEDLQNRQAEFARASGIPAGTVSSALKRFRDRYGFDERSREWRLEHLYTTHGGSSS
jgi:hypothetical protein